MTKNLTTNSDLNLSSSDLAEKSDKHKNVSSIYHLLKMNRTRKESTEKGSVLANYKKQSGSNNPLKKVEVIEKAYQNKSSSKPKISTDFLKNLIKSKQTKNEGKKTPLITASKTIDREVIKKTKIILDHSKKKTLFEKVHITKTCLTNVCSGKEPKSSLMSKLDSFLKPGLASGYSKAERSLSKSRMYGQKTQGLEKMSPRRHSTKKSRDLSIGSFSLQNFNIIEPQL